ncbi:MAG TPA: nucleotidyl transferase AbiEii/AbiGii toxin family protein [Bacteroidales bacterium]|jgi:predicted nucleotidyltransferase component of viral defense system|nr:nucleotidyl transferase AbiEii/AbiGii toxin family protein [Bacteroidales bacterium]HQM69425.1 nucleotidyl transferase AbiEii/AbiGii toxin family protein [Bacteroidales bacterium]
MIDINRHKFFLVQILKDIYSDIELANYLGFKGGTSLMFFYDLPRLSLDLDFNLTDPEKVDFIYKRVRRILLQYAKIYDEAKKFYGPIIVLDYGVSERKLKVEISKRSFNDRYEIKNFLGINMKVMVQEDMFAHKLCALTDRKEMANRDVFDCWFFMNRRTPVNQTIVEFRTGMNFREYVGKCIEKLESTSGRSLLHGIGELIDVEMKKFVKTKMLTEVIKLLKFYQEFPIS